MRLDEYLKAIEECPDEILEVIDEGHKQKVHRLTWELGVYDNWPIFLQADFATVLGYLQSSDYRRGETFKESSGVNIQFFYNPGTVELQVMDFVPLSLGTSDLTEEEKSHSQRQERDYNTGLILHPYQDKMIEGVDWQRAIALVVKDIGTFAQKEHLGLCFPRSMGWSNLNDYSRIVYFDPQESSVPTEN